MANGHNSAFLTAFSLSIRPRKNCSLYGKRQCIKHRSSFLRLKHNFNIKDRSHNGRPIEFYEKRSKHLLHENTRIWLAYWRSRWIAIKLKSAPFNSLIGGSRNQNIPKHLNPLEFVTVVVKFRLKCLKSKCYKPKQQIVIVLNYNIV